MSNAPTNMSPFWVRILTIAGLVIVGIVVVSTWKSPRAAWRSRASRQNVPPVSETQPDSPMWTEPLQTPDVVSAADAQLADEAEVIGVNVDDQSRAYSLKAMQGVGEQVVNDVVNNVAITVAYSYRNDFVRVFGDRRSDAALRINVAAWIKKKLHVAYNGDQFRLDDSAFPVADWKFQRTTWKDWRTRFPKTDVYETPPSFSDPANNDPAGPTWITYKIDAKSVGLPVSLEYPSGWQVAPRKESATLRIGPVKSSGTSPFIDLTPRTFDQAIDAQSYFRGAFDLDQAKTSYKDFRLLESAVIQIGSYPTRHVVFQFSDNKQARTAIVFSIWTKQGGCHLFASGSTGEGSAWQAICERLSDSIRIGEDVK